MERWGGRDSEKRNKDGRKGGGVKGGREEKVLICFLSKASLQMWRILDNITEKKKKKKESQLGPKTAEPSEAQSHRV